MAKKTIRDSAEKLHQRAEAHNYDHIPSKLRWIIRSKNCDLGTALLVYWRGDPNYYRLFPNRWEMKDDAGADVALFDVLVEIEQRVIDGKYKKFEIQFDPFRDIGGTNWTENHYEFAWEDFYCDLPVQMYGKPTARKLNGVRPESDRPVGLSVIANAEDDTFDAKTQAAIDALEKYNRDGSWGGVNLVDDGDVDGVRVNFEHQKVPDRIFQQLKSIPNVVSLAFGDKHTDSVLKYLKYTPDLQRLDLNGTFTLRGMSNLKHVGQLRSLGVWYKEKQSNGRWLASLSHVPNLESLQISCREFVKLPLDVFSGLAKLQDLTMFCQFPTDADFRPLQKLNLREVWLGGRKITDAHIDALLPLSKMRKLKRISFLDSRFSDTGLEILRKAFKKKLEG